MAGSLVCAIAGHKFVLGEHNEDTWTWNVTCVRCGLPVEWSAKVVCGKFGHKYSGGGCVRCGKQIINPEMCEHNWKVIGVQHYSTGKTGDIAKGFGINQTMRQYECEVCGTNKSDEHYEWLNGRWALDASEKLVPVMIKGKEVI